MGRCKIQMKKIENNTVRQVTYSKRKSGLLKKGYELSTLCDTDVALMMFSPSGRLSCFSSRRRIEEVFARFLDLPEIDRAGMIQNEEFVRATLQRLMNEFEVASSGSPQPEKTAATEMLKEQIAKTECDIAIAEAKLRFFEPDISKMRTLREIESYERFLTDAVGHYEKRLKEIEEQQPVTDSMVNQQKKIESNLPSQNSELPPCGQNCQPAGQATSSSTAPHMTHSRNQTQGGFLGQQLIHQSQNEGSSFNPLSVLHCPGQENYMMQMNNQLFNSPFGFADPSHLPPFWNPQITPHADTLYQQYLMNSSATSGLFNDVSNSFLGKQNGPSTATAGPSNLNFSRELAGSGHRATSVNVQLPRPGSTLNRAFLS